MKPKDKIRRFRNDARLSQKELADKAGISQQLISAYESGRSLPTLGTIVDIAAALNVSIGDIDENLDVTLKSKGEIENYLLSEPSAQYGVSDKDPVLMEVLNNWDSLSDNAKNQILAIVIKDKYKQ